MNDELQHQQLKYFSKKENIQWIVDYLNNFINASQFNYHHVELDQLHLNSNYIYIESCFNLVNDHESQDFELKDELLELYFEVFHHNPTYDFKEFISKLFPHILNVKCIKKYAVTKVEENYFLSIFNFNKSYFVMVRHFEDAVEHPPYISAIMSRSNDKIFYKQTLIDFHALLKEIQNDFLEFSV